MSQRVDVRPGELIDRSEQLHFRLDGQLVPAYRGDTFASALWAQGRRSLAGPSAARRASALKGFGPFDPGGRCWVDGVTDAPIATRRAYDGAVLLSAPQWLASIGTASGHPIALSRRYDSGRRSPTMNWSADVAVVGAGAAGMAAALAAADAGAEVVLLEADQFLGGQALWSWPDDARESELLPLMEAVGDHPTIRTVTGANVVECSAAGQVVAVVEPGAGPGGPSLATVTAQHVVIATGLRERSLSFAGSELPGVVTSGGACRLATLWAVRPGSRAVIVSTVPLPPSQAVPAQPGDAAGGPAAEVDAGAAVPSAMEPAGSVSEAAAGPDASGPDADGPDATAIGARLDAGASAALVGGADADRDAEPVGSAEAHADVGGDADSHADADADADADAGESGQPQSWATYVDMVAAQLRATGVEVVASLTVGTCAGVAAIGEHEVRAVELPDGRRIDADLVVTVAGATPDATLLAGAGVTVTTDGPGRAQLTNRNPLVSLAGVIAGPAGVRDGRGAAERFAPDVDDAAAFVARAGQVGQAAAAAVARTVRSRLVPPAAPVVLDQLGSPVGSLWNGAAGSLPKEHEVDGAEVEAALTGGAAVVSRVLLRAARSPLADVASRASLADLVLASCAASGPAATAGEPEVGGGPPPAGAAAPGPLDGAEAAVLADAILAAGGSGNGPTLGALGALAAPVLRRSPLTIEHEALGGRLVRWGEWLDVVDYGDPDDERDALEYSAGMADLARCGLWDLRGPDVVHLLEAITARPGHTDTDIDIDTATDLDNDLVTDLDNDLGVGEVMMVAPALPGATGAVGVPPALGTLGGGLGGADLAPPATMLGLARVAPDHWELVVPAELVGPARAALALITEFDHREWRAHVTDVADAWCRVAVRGPRAAELVTSAIPSARAGAGVRQAWTDPASGVSGTSWWWPAEPASRAPNTPLDGPGGPVAVDLAVPAGYAPWLWRALLRAARPLRGRPVGFEAFGAQLTARPPRQDSTTGVTHG